MAKERDGSINIYGSLQAKTEDGYVAYTDGIAHENEDGTTTSLDQLLADGVGGGGIIDVDKLPQSGWSGTTVPVDGSTVVENIYLNNNLSIEGTIAEMDKITDWIDPNGDGSNYMYILLINEDETIGPTFLKMSGVYAIMDNFTGVTYFISDGSVMGLDFSGWNPNVTYPVAFNSVSLTEVDGMNIGQENDKITELFSATPIEYVTAKVNDKSIYRLKEPDKTHLVGTLLQSNPETMVNKVVFNDKLSVDETVNILSQLTYIEFNGMNVNILYSNSTGTSVFVVSKETDGYIINHMTNIQTFEYTRVFISYELISGELGWVNTEYEINDTGVSDLMGLPIGTENDKLTELLSMNNNFNEVADSYKYTYWVYKDKWVQLIDGDNLPDFGESKGFEIVDLGEHTLKKPTGSSAGIDSIDYTNINLTKEIYEKITTKTNVILKVGILISKGGISGSTNVYLFPHKVGKAYFYVNGQLMSETQQGIYTSVADSFSVNYEDTSISSGDPDYYTFESQYDSSNDVYFGTFSIKNYSIFGSKLTVDEAPTENSTDPVSSGGVYTALQTKQNKITVTENDDGTVDITIPTE